MIDWLLNGGLCFSVDLCIKNLYLILLLFWHINIDGPIIDMPRD